MGLKGNIALMVAVLWKGGGVGRNMSPPAQQGKKSPVRIGLTFYEIMLGVGLGIHAIIDTECWSLTNPF